LNAISLKIWDLKEKTSITSFKESFAFLGFDISSCVVRMWPKSVEKFKDKIQEITECSYNFDAEVVIRVNQIMRGTANYFAT
jgi:hypothetical protein